MKRLLLVEDDSTATMIAKFALEAAWRNRGADIEIITATNGLEAVNWLLGLQSDEELPDLILSDVNMPLLDGQRLLRLLKQDERFRKIPVVMLTTSENPIDISMAFDGFCAGYLVKNADFDKFCADLEALQHYWEASELP